MHAMRAISLDVLWLGLSLAVAQWRFWLMVTVLHDA
jgi:hypothetical protein